MRTFKLIAGLSFLLLMVACQDKKRSSQIEVAENESKYVVLAYIPFSAIHCALGE